MPGGRSGGSRYRGQGESGASTILVMRPDLDVVVVTYNSVHVIGDLLDSLPPALGALTADVIVVDNG
jgi:hypothetical protein